MTTITGGAFDDTLSGTNSSDSLVGGGGDDLLIAGVGADSLVGGAGNDVYVQSAFDYDIDAYVEAAGEGTDTLIWNTGEYARLAANIEILRVDDPNTLFIDANGSDNSVFGNEVGNWIRAFEGADVVVGGGGNDTLEGGGGVDTLYGGVGNDIYEISDADDEAREYAGEGIDTVRIGEDLANAGPYQMGANIENLVRGFYKFPSGSTSISGNDLNNVIDDFWSDTDTIAGHEGDDWIRGGGSLNGGDGDDVLAGGWAATLTGGAGADVFTVGYAAATVTDYVDGEDKIAFDFYTFVSKTDDNGDALLTFHSKDEGDTVMRVVGVSSVDITEADMLRNAAAPAAGDGGHTSAAAQTLTGGAGFDVLHGDAGDDLIDGGVGNDDLFGGAGADTLVGGDGRDVLDGDAGADQMEGGAGNDTYVVREGADQVVEAAGEGLDTVRAFASGYVLGDNVENLDLRYSQAATGSGNDDDNVVFGNTKANTLSGGGGADSVYGGGGNDAVRGGDGDDWLNGGGGGRGYILAGDAYVDGGDTLTGGAGFDRFLVGSRADNGMGGSGNDVVTDFADGEDTLEFWAVRGMIDVTIEQVGADTRVSGSGSSITLLNVAAEDITAEDFLFASVGTGGDDTMQGSSANDLMDAGTGNDRLIGAGGHDQLLGGFGNDLYVVDGEASVMEQAGQGTDTVVSAGSFTLGENLENLTLTAAGLASDLAGASALQAPSGRATIGVGNALDNRLLGSTESNVLAGAAGDDLIEGRKGKDRLYGGDGADSLDGGRSKDVLDGGQGADTLTGGIGADRFVIAFTDARDLIGDFDAGQGDVVDLSRIDADGTADGNQAFHLAGKLHGVAGEAVLQYDEAHDRTLLKADIDSDGRSDFSLMLNGHVAGDEGWVF